MLSSPSIHGGSTLLQPETVFRKIGIESGQVVADLGCGGGAHFAFSAANLVGKNGTVYAVDVQKNVLLSVKTRAESLGIPQLKTVHANVEKLGSTAIDDAVCDHAIIVNVLFQNKNHEAILREAARLVKTGGLLTVIDWKKTASAFGPPQELRTDPTIITQQAVAAGLRFFDEFDAGPYHYAIVFKK